MNTTTPKPKKTINTPADVITTEKTAKKNTAEKSVTTKPIEIVEVAESPATVSIKKRKPAKTKVIRDSFSFPEQDYVKISELKKACLAAGMHVKKGEILRAGLLMLTKLSLTELIQTLELVEKIQTGRPKSSKSQQ